MTEDSQNPKAFESFRVLNGDANVGECDQLFRNMAQLFSITSDRCDDDQVSQYDQVLCQLAEMVEAEARGHVAKVLAPLDRAPGRVVVRLASDSIEVARPLLEFSKVLSDDDLIEIIGGSSEEHRVAIAGRPEVGQRVGDAIVHHGQRPSMVRLVRNEAARLGPTALEKIIERAANDSDIASDLRGRGDIDWQGIASQFSAAGMRLVEKLALDTKSYPQSSMGRASAVAFSRLRNRVGFNAQEWKLAWNQVKAVNDRRQLDTKAIARFARFSYGHHVACGLTIMLNVPSDVMVKWLSAQDFVALTVALRAMGLDPELVAEIFPVLPWRDALSREDVDNVMRRFEALSYDEARGIFKLWRAHAFRRRAGASNATEAVA